MCIRDRIERFVEEQLGDREKIYASELPMETMDDFIRLIYVRLYGSRKIGRASCRERV